MSKNIQKFLNVSLFLFVSMLASARANAAVSVDCLDGPLAGVTNSVYAIGEWTYLDSVFYTDLFMYSIAVNIEDSEDWWSYISSYDLSEIGQFLIHYLAEPQTWGYYSMDSDIVIGGSFIPPFVDDDDCWEPSLYYEP